MFRRFLAIRFDLKPFAGADNLHKYVASIGAHTSSGACLQLELHSNNLHHLKNNALNFDKLFKSLSRHTMICKLSRIQ